MLRGSRRRTASASTRSKSTWTTLSPNDSPSKSTPPVQQSIIVPQEDNKTAAKKQRWHGGGPRLALRICWRNVWRPVWDRFFGPTRSTPGPRWMRLIRVMTVGALLLCGWGFVILQLGRFGDETTHLSYLATTVGDGVDCILNQIYWLLYSWQDQPQSPRLFPMTLRANRKTVPGTSRYLTMLYRQWPRSPGNPTAIMDNSDNHGVGSGMDVERWEIGPWNYSERIATQLKRHGCRPGWVCRRCLHTGFGGSFPACTWACPACYSQILCSNQSQNTALLLSSTHRSQPSKASGSPIPHMIHQTWREPLRTMDYPELVRMQNAWIATGFSYRFYSHQTALAWVKKHYPDHMFRAYQSIPSVEVQLDFFRLLALYVHGGVASSADLMLETNLASFLAGNLSFFAAIDDDHFGYCLWPGWLGASPGHPLIAQAIHQVWIHLLAHPSDRAEQAERSLCQRHWATELWRVRVEGVDNAIYGPCVLGRAVNRGLERKDLWATFQPGTFQQGPANLGSILFLLMSRADTGAFRCTDLDRNLLVASTNMIGFTSKRAHERSASIRSLQLV